VRVLFGGKLATRKHVTYERRGTMFIEVAVDLVIDRERGRLVAATETGDVANSNIFVAVSSESFFNAALQVESSSQVTRHIGADTHFSLGWRCEMKVGIKTGYRMNLAKGYSNSGSEFLQPIGRQVAELMLNGPEFVDQATGSP
jgi:hypothetical protein